MLEPGGIDHSESSRNNQSKLIRNSQTSWLRTPALTWTLGNAYVNLLDVEELKNSF